MVRGAVITINTADNGPPAAWASLNGLWSIDYSVQDLNSPPFGKTLPEQILVPYPIESSLSGIRKQAPNSSMFYKRLFAEGLVPGCNTADGSRRTLLHFEAVDYNTTLWINGHQVGSSHIGGYDPFSFDITEHLQLEPSAAGGDEDDPLAGSQTHEHDEREGA